LHNKEAIKSSKIKFKALRQHSWETQELSLSTWSVSRDSMNPFVCIMLKALPQD